MKKQSAGMVLFREVAGSVEVLLVHPGGPFWAKKDLGAWSIPKGEFAESEAPIDAARREFAEELGRELPAGEQIELGQSKQSGGKVVFAWALRGDLDPSTITSNTFELEWPPRSGQKQKFPEVDRAAWFDMAEARARLVTGQVAFFDRLAEHLGVAIAEPIPTPSSESQKTEPKPNNMQTKLL